MDKKELINEIAKYACNACEMGGDFDGDCHDLIGEYTTCGICQGTANKIYDDFICKYIVEFLFKFPIIFIDISSLIFSDSIFSNNV